MTARTVELTLTQGQLTEIAQTINTWDKLWAAIGYLSTWASDSPDYVSCHIRRDSNSPDLVAVYRDADGEIRYLIGAIWHDTHYGFHS